MSNAIKITTKNFRHVKGTPLGDLAKVSKSASSIFCRFSPDRLDQFAYGKNHSIALFKLNKIGFVRSDHLISIGQKIDYRPRIAQKLCKKHSFWPADTFRDALMKRYRDFRDAPGLVYHLDSKNPTPGVLEFSHNRLGSDQVQISRVFRKYLENGDS